MILIAKIVKSDWSFNRIGIVWKGTWRTSETIEMLDPTLQPFGPFKLSFEEVSHEDQDVLFF